MKRPQKTENPNYSLILKIPANGHHIGTVQIPHHGSGYNNGHYSLKYLNKPRWTISVISCGQINRYNHPSNKTISDIIKFGGYPITVTENATSVFITHCKLTY